MRVCHMQLKIKKIILLNGRLFNRITEFHFWIRELTFCIKIEQNHVRSFSDILFTHLITVYVYKMLHKNVF